MHLTLAVGGEGCKSVGWHRTWQWLENEKSNLRKVDIDGYVETCMCVSSEESNEFN